MRFKGLNQKISLVWVFLLVSRPLFGSPFFLLLVPKNLIFRSICSENPLGDVTYFTHTLSITPQPYHSQTLFSPFHLAGASNDDVNIQAIEKSSIGRSYILVLSAPSENFLSINQLLSPFLSSCLHRTFTPKHFQYQYNLHHSTKRRN
jgi:hypothetical protein